MSDGEESDDGLEVIYGAEVQAEHVAGYLADPFQNCNNPHGRLQDSHYAATHSSVRAKRVPSTQASAAPRPSRLMNQVADFETDGDVDYKHFEVGSMGGEGKEGIDLPPSEAAPERRQLKRTAHSSEDSYSGSLGAGKRPHRQTAPSSHSSSSRRHASDFLATLVGSSNREAKPKQSGIRGIVEASLRATHAAAFDEDIGRLGANRKQKTSKGSSGVKRGSQSATQAPKSTDVPWRPGRTFQPDSFRSTEPSSRKANTSKRAMLAEPVFPDPAARGKFSTSAPKSSTIAKERVTSVSMDRPSHWGGSSEKKRRKPNDDDQKRSHHMNRTNKQGYTVSQESAANMSRVQLGSSQMTERLMVNIADGAFSTPAVPRHRHHSGRGNSTTSTSSDRGDLHSSSRLHHRSSQEELPGTLPSQDFLHRSNVKALPTSPDKEPGNELTRGNAEGKAEYLADNNDSTAYDDGKDGYENQSGSNVDSRNRSSSFHRPSQPLLQGRDQESVPCTPVNSKTAPSSTGTTSVAQSFAPKPSPATFRTPTAPRPSLHARDGADGSLASTTNSGGVPHTWSGLSSFASIAQQQQRSSDGSSSHDYGDSAGKRVKASSRCGHGPLSKRLQAQRKLLDGDVARLRSGQYQKGGAEGFAPLNAMASGDPRARALVALDLTLMPQESPPLPVLGAGPFHTTATGGSYGLHDGAHSHRVGSAHDGACLPSFVAYVHTTTLSDDDNQSGPAPSPKPSTAQPPSSSSSVPSRRNTWLSLAMPPQRSKAENDAGSEAGAEGEVVHLNRSSPDESKLNGRFVRIVFQSTTVRVSDFWWRDFSIPSFSPHSLSNAYCNGKHSKEIYFVKLSTRFLTLCYLSSQHHFTRPLLLASLISSSDSPLAVSFESTMPSGCLQLQLPIRQICP